MKIILTNMDQDKISKIFSEKINNLPMEEDNTEIE